jgi:hypothetical protein
LPAAVVVVETEGLPQHPSIHNKEKGWFFLQPFFYEKITSYHATKTSMIFSTSKNMRFIPFDCVFMMFFCLFSSIFTAHLSPASAEQPDDQEALILNSAEMFFVSLKEGNYKTSWELLSEKSQKTIVNDVYDSSKKMEVDIEKEDIIRDFDENGTIAQNYWNALASNFNPEIVLEERVWEFETIQSDYAAILLKNGASTKLHLYHEYNQWKVGFVETFWEKKTMKILKKLLSWF